MRVFFDTSALAKRYVQENGSEQINKIFKNSSHEFFVSILTLPEIFSAMSRLRRESRLTKKQYQEIKDALLREFDDFHVCDLTSEVVRQAVELLEKYTLRTLDAMHLACAVMIKADLFVSSDTQQIKAAKNLSLAVMET
ncbi:MAG TPA: type II toxin-antitoxin system VapC family toxin [Candidatus Bathyarchaeia archaeon]|nr:type II toxin-antitoxin system VapC family toxin [Candidatus Bathyarchaeia archaeon]